MTEAPLVYKGMKNPHLDMRLELGTVYTRMELEARCGRKDPARGDEAHWWRIPWLTVHQIAIHVPFFLLRRESNMYREFIIFVL